MYPGILVGLGPGKSFCVKSQWLHEVFLPGSREAAVPKSLVKKSVGLCLNALSGVSGSQAWRRLCWPWGVSNPKCSSRKISTFFRRLEPVPWQWLNRREAFREPFRCELRGKQSWGIQERLLQQLIALTVSILFSLGVYHTQPNQVLLLGALCSKSSVGSAGSIRAKIPLVPGAGVDIEIPQSNHPLELPFGLLTPSICKCLLNPQLLMHLCPLILCEDHIRVLPPNKDHPSPISGDNIPYLLQVSQNPPCLGTAKGRTQKVPSNSKIPSNSLPPFRQIYLN